MTTSDELKSLLQAINGADEVFLDTEADSLHHYFEKICLLQFTIPGNDSMDASHFLVDPLAGLDLKPLFEVLKDKPLVLHGADYDLRMLRAGFDFTPAAIFDTMLAARLAGHSALGLDALVERYTGKQLDHGAQKADWSQRPLPPRLLNYAVEDTRYLPLLAKKLREELSVLGRSEWHRQQCRQLIETSSVVRERDPDEIWRIKGSSKLDRQGLAILRELWKWRDTEAQQWDRPPFMVCRNEQLLEWTDWAVAQVSTLHKTGKLADKDACATPFPTHHSPSSSLPPKLPPRWRPSRVKSLRQALERARKLSEGEWPDLPPRNKRPPYNPEFNARMDRLREARDVLARKFNLNPSLLASGAMLAAVASRNPKCPDDFGEIDRWLPWQTEALSPSFLQVLTMRAGHFENLS